MSDFKVTIQSPEDLPKLTTLFAVWYRSPLHRRGQLDYWLIKNIKIELDHNTAGASTALVYPDTCICGNIFDPVRGSRLRRWCAQCHGSLGQWLPALSCEAWILEHCMSKAIVLVNGERSDRIQKHLRLVSG